MFYRDKSLKQSENNNYLKINHNYKKKSASVKLKTNWINVIYLLPVFVAFISYINGLTGDFVHDDVYAIKKNADVLGKSDIVNVFYNDYWGLPVHMNESHKSYRPLTVLTFRLNHWLFGLNSCSFHVVNVCLHVMVTALLVYTCRHVIGLGEKCSCIAGLLFAVHPIHAEAVTGIVGRADVLAALFYLLSFIAYSRSMNVNQDQTYHVPFVISMIMAGIAMLCKETGVTAIGLCVVYDVIILVNQSRKQKTVYMKSLVTRIALAACWTVVILSLRIKIMGRHLPRFTHSANPASFSDSMATRWMTYSYLWSYNFWLMLLPYKLCYDWQHASIPLIEHVTDLRNLATIICITVIMYIVYQTFREWRNIQRKTEETRPSNHFMLISVAMTTIPFLPASNLLFPVGFVLAERVLYIPSMGFCICVAVGICKLQERWSVYNHHMMSLTCLVLMMLTFKTWKQNTTWQSRETLFRSGIQVMPHNAKVHFNYANFLKSCDMTEEAIYHYKTAISLDDHYPSAHNNLATLLTDDIEVERHLRRTIMLQPNHQRAHMNLGSLLFNQGQRSLGASYLYKAVDIDRTNPEVLTTLAHYLLEVGNITEAEYYLRQAEDIDPEYSDIYTLYGSIYSKQGKEQNENKHFVLQLILTFAILPWMGRHSHSCFGHIKFTHTF
ncbi:Protein O-mannosyl-transferase tmtc2 [Mactra antiquata]